MAPANYLGRPLPAAVARAWNGWDAAAWRKTVHYSQNDLYPPDQRFRVHAPPGMCRRHLDVRRGYRDMQFDPRSAVRWPGGAGCPFTVFGRMATETDVRRELGWRRREWDEAASRQMRLAEELCLSGDSPQCEGEPRTCAGCGRMACRCEVLDSSQAIA